MSVSRAIWMVGAAAGLGLAAAISPAASADTDPIPVSGTGATVAQPEAYLFTVQAVSGTTMSRKVAKGEDERFTLTLTGVEPVTKFADRPFTDALVMSPKALTTNWSTWFSSAPPNAVLTYAVGAGKAPQSIVITLTKPTWNATDRALMFTATRIYRTLDPSAKGKNWTRPATPESFATASLFIDDATDPCDIPNGAFNCDGADLSSQNIPNMTITAGSFDGANFTNADLSGATILNSTFTNANFTGANLTGIATITNDFSGADFTGANLTSAELTWANLTGANLSGADLYAAETVSANLTGAISDASTTCTDGYPGPCSNASLQGQRN